MFRWILIAAFSLPVYAQALLGQAPPEQTKPKTLEQRPGAKPKPGELEEEAPPEEDASAKPKEYSFNPLKAATELRVGNYYFKRGKYRAAADRYREASLWNPTLAEAFLRMGEADEKQHDKKSAKEAYTKYLEMAPDAKDATEVKKKLSKL
jgi:tetratricopeptide (TPR) repeat protein